MFEAATIALHANKTVLEHSASKVTSGFIVNENWQRNVGVCEMGSESGKVSLNDVVSSGFFGFVPLISKTPGDFASEFKCADFSSIAACWRTYLIVDVRRLPDLLREVNYLPVKSCFNYAEIPYDASIFRKCRLRGPYGGPWVNYDFSALG